MLFQKKAGQPESCMCAALRLLQFLPRASLVAGYPRNGSGYHGSRLDDCRITGAPISLRALLHADFLNDGSGRIEFAPDQLDILIPIRGPLTAILKRYYLLK